MPDLALALRKTSVRTSVLKQKQKDEEEKQMLRQVPVIASEITKNRYSIQPILYL